MADNDKAIIDSWCVNAMPWTDAVRNADIESRRLCTDAAVLDAVLGRHPASVIDLGCGEGWLARKLAAQGIDVLGVDAVPTLIEQAQAAGAGTYRVLGYEAIAEGALEECADVVVCNFSLIGGRVVDDLLAGMPSLLSQGGVLIVQTLHPLQACGDLPYQDGWRTGSWDGFSDSFRQPAPWYFRTLQSWVQLIAASGLHLLEIREPVDPRNGRPASVVLVASSI